LLSLAEAAADDEAIGKVKDRTFYAGLLVDFASRGARTGFVGVEMARGGTVTHRVERMLGDSALYYRSSRIRRILFIVGFIPILGFSTVVWTVRAESRVLASPGRVLPAAQSVAPAQPSIAQQPAVPVTQAQSQTRQSEDAFLSKWIEKEVPDISTQAERDAFRALKTDEERNQFIESFWLRRDPTPPTPENEFRTEYYRRVDVANRRFVTNNGPPGWLTDRGRVLILLGEADEVETHAQGGTYVRNDGAVRTNSFPFERWRYRHIEGIGNNVILEFVDSSMSGEYRLEFDPAAKDALLHVPAVDSPPSVAPGAPQK